MIDQRRIRREALVDRARGCCEYCGSQERFAMQSFCVEHTTPRSRGGESTDDNLALACQGCNNHKYDKVGARDPLSAEDVPLFHPRRDRWSDHFAWSNDFTMIIGLTPTGRATVEALQLNRSGVVNLRHILYAMGEHPVGPTDSREAPQ
jgi:hypothetical protein